MKVIEPGRYDQIVINNKTKIHEKAIRRELGKVETDAIVEKDALERAVWLIGDMANAESKTALRGMSALIMVVTCRIPRRS